MSEPIVFLSGRVRLYAGDCGEVIRTLPDDSIDSVVTDPPYALVSIVKRFGKEGSAEAKSNGATGVYKRASSGFMGKQWDTGQVAFDPEFWAEVCRVLKPGGHVVAFAGTRTYHRLACAIEDAGFEIRDQIGWAYGSGFPKSHDVSKGIDRAAGARREVVGRDKNYGTSKLADGKNAFGDYAGEWELTAPASDDAIRWQGWGTALKPSWEPIVLARKPLIGTVAANVLQHGTGALNIDGCRVATQEGLSGGGYSPQKADRHDGDERWRFKNGGAGSFKQPSGRWPANIVHDGSEEVVGAFPETRRGEMPAKRSDVGFHGGGGGTIGERIVLDAGSAARFFYSAKADSDDRIGSKHPTVKPVDLMRWLCRLITPPNGTILDPFAGTGTTGEAAFYEGFNAVLIEREAEYQADIERRMALVMTGPDERSRQIAKAKAKPDDLAGTMFA